MNLPKMIAELQDERDRLDKAILALERLSTAGGKRRSRRTDAGTGPNSKNPSDRASDGDGSDSATCPATSTQPLS